MFHVPTKLQTPIRTNRVLQQLLTLIPNNFSTIGKNGKGNSNLQIAQSQKELHSLSIIFRALQV
jgi:hypothetical protein